MFAKKEKPLPLPRVVAQENDAIAQDNSPRKETGIILGEGVNFDPEKLPNGHILAVGASGSGKTQTLKGIAWGLHNQYCQLQIIIIDFHGDQDLIGETCYPLHMKSPYGINPLVLNLDEEGGGPALQAIAVAAVIRKSLRLGPNQEGFLLEILEELYREKGITQEEHSSWLRTQPNFSDLREHLEMLTDEGHKEAPKLKLKLSAMFRYGIFSREQLPLEGRLIRVDLSKLPPALGAIAAESLARQLMDSHRLLGEIEGKIPRTYIFIDEAKEMPKSSDSAIDRIIADGRKYGLNLALASQSERHLSKDVIGNSSTKIVLPVDQTDVKKTATRFRFSEDKVAQLKPLQALCRMGTDAKLVSIEPYYRRVQCLED